MLHYGESFDPQSLSHPVEALPGSPRRSRAHPDGSKSSLRSASASNASRSSMSLSGHSQFSRGSAKSINNWGFTGYVPRVANTTRPYPRTPPGGLPAMSKGSARRPVTYTRPHATTKGVSERREGLLNVGYRLHDQHFARGALHPHPPTPRTNCARLEAPPRLITNILEAEYCRTGAGSRMSGNPLFSTYKLHVLENHIGAPERTTAQLLQQVCTGATSRSYSARGMRWQANKATAWIDKQSEWLVRNTVSTTDTQSSREEAIAPFNDRAGPEGQRRSSFHSRSHSETRQLQKLKATRLAELQRNRVPSLREVNKHANLLSDSRAFTEESACSPPSRDAGRQPQVSEKKLAAKVDAQARRKAAAFGSTPLIVAVDQNDLALLRRMLLAGENPDRGRTSDGRTPLGQAAAAGKNAFVTHLINAGASVDNGAHNGCSPLQLAVLAGHTDAIAQLLKHGAQVDQPDGKGRNPLHFAAKMGREEPLALLLHAGAAINARTKSGATALFTAAKNGREGVIAQLLSGAADCAVSNAAKESPLFVAAQNGQSGAVQQLLAAGAAVNQVNKTQATPLFVAAQEGLHGELITLLLKEGAQIDQGDQEGRTPLHIAAECGHRAIITQLLSAGASSTLRTAPGPPATTSTQKRSDEPQDKKARKARFGGDAAAPPIPPPAAPHQHQARPNILRGAAIEARQAAPEIGLLPWEIAQQAGHLPLIDVLRDHRVLSMEQESAAGSGSTGLSQLRAVRARRKMDEERAREAFEIEQRKWCSDQARQPKALFTAAQIGDTKAVALLLAAGSSIDQVGERGQTSLHVSAGNGHQACTAQLLAAGADANAVGTMVTKATPLFIAACKGRAGAVKLLLSAGAVNQPRGDGATPLHAAASAGQEQIVQLLLNAGAPVDSLDKQEQTPLWVAAGSGHSRVCQLLLAAGANANHTNKYGVTTIAAAAAAGQEQAIRVMFAANSVVGRAAAIAAENGHDRAAQLLQFTDSASALEPEADAEAHVEHGELAPHAPDQIHEEHEPSPEFNDSSYGQN